HQQQPLSTSNAILPSNTISPTTTKAVINTVPFDETDSLKTHVRKGSSTKKSIEYQLLEEEIAPVSPPRNNTPIATDAFGLPVFVPPPPPIAANNIIRTGPSLSDPFDIQWSTAVLKNVATKTTTTSNGGINGTTHSPTAVAVADVPNPFTSESAPVNV
uniref:Uncharacterized protein n=1 Tax=Panagrolaimus sp. ES5 TaxID=591445 RepID=A0AC34GC91_9BILA